MPAGGPSGGEMVVTVTSLPTGEVHAETSISVHTIDEPPHRYGKQLENRPFAARFALTGSRLTHDCGVPWCSWLMK
jgi:hypothetical protein